MDRSERDTQRPAPSSTRGTSDPARAVPPRRDPSRADTTEPELRVLGDFRILRRLGEGGMGAVYLAYDARNARLVALKVLNDALTENQNYIDRFHREARSGSQLNHPNIVRTFAAGQDTRTGKYYLVLEYVDGPSAHAVMSRQGRLSVGDAVRIALDVAKGLEHAHGKNIVHRDIKPDNILLTKSGVAKLGDLGLAKRTDEASHLTGTKQGFGTTAYMPYEQAISAKSADGRSDIYALGATLYHLLTGVVPFPGDNHLEVIEKKQQGAFRPARSYNAGVPAVLDRILSRMLAKRQADRYPTAGDLILELERSNLGSPVPSFADAEAARKDPRVRAAVEDAEPTRPDPQTPPPRVAPATDESTWHVRYRNRAGRWFSASLTLGAVIARLRAGTIPLDAQVRREESDPPGTFADFGVFRPHLPEPSQRPTRLGDEDDAETPGPSFRVLLLSAAALAAGLLVLAKWLWPN